MRRFEVYIFKRVNIFIKKKKKGKNGREEKNNYFVFFIWEII